MIQAPALQIRHIYTRHEPVLLGTAGLLLLVGGWELTAWSGWLNPVVLSSPSRIGEAFLRQWASGELLRDLWISVAELAVGFGLAALVGLAVGVVMGLQRDVEYALDPFIWFLYSAPLIAFYPLLIVWLGFGFPSVVAITFLLATVPIAVNTLTAVRSVDPLLVRVVRAYGGRTSDLIGTVILPASLPLVVAGLRIGIARALIGVVIGEMFGANAGLGFRLTYYGARLRTSDVLVPIVAIMLLGLLATQVLRIFEHRVARWRRT
ncbi:MAG: ABC transporter permease [Chloroflexi bacterium]|nr:ABC transporter permease [Chloroflexota bacterium]